MWGGIDRDYSVVTLKFGADFFLLGGCRQLDRRAPVGVDSLATLRRVPNKRHVPIPQEWLMMKLRTRFLLAWLASAILVFAVACGEDDPASNGESNNQDPNQVNNQDPGGDECGENETVNPITGDCIEASPNNDDPNQDPNNQSNNDDPNNQDPNNQSNNDDPNNQSNNQDEFECGPGGLIGQTCRPDGGAIPGATVTMEGFDCDGSPFEEETTADGEGYYDFEGVPAGDHTISIKSGSFEATEDVTIVKDQITDRESIGEKVCLTGDEVDIAVVTGSFDDIGGILDDLSIDYDTYTTAGSLMGDLDLMRDYEIIFVECSANISGADQEFNTRRFVEEGGSLYASDLSWRTVQNSMPESVIFAGEDPDNPGSTPSGDPVSAGITDSQTVMADVVSTEMLNVLGTDEIEIYYNFSSVGTIAAPADPGGVAHFRADIEVSSSDYTDGIKEDAPLMVTFDDPLGSGFMIYTSFHNSQQASDDIMNVLEYMVFQL